MEKLDFNRHVFMPVSEQNKTDKWGAMSLSFSLVDAPVDDINNPLRPRLDRAVQLHVIKPLVLSSDTSLGLGFYQSLDHTSVLSEQQLSTLTNSNHLALKRYAFTQLTPAEQAQYAKTQGYDAIVDMSTGTVTVTTAEQVSALPTKPLCLETDFDLYAYLTDLKYAMQRAERRAAIPHGRHQLTEMDEYIYAYHDLKQRIESSSLPAIKRCQTQIESITHVTKVLQRISEGATDSSMVLPKTALFHGSNADFDDFDPNRMGANTGYSGSSKGIFLTKSKLMADNYATGAASRNGGTPHTMVFEVQLNNARFFETSTEFYAQLDKHGDALFDSLKAQGFDGVVVRNDLEEVVVFEPNHVCRVRAGSSEAKPINTTNRTNVMSI